MVAVENLTKHFRARKQGFFEKAGTVRALDGISFSIPEGETLGMVGESGSGKTTAARAMLRLIEPDNGEIRIDGTDVHQLRRRELRQFRKNMQIVFQDPFSSLNPRMNISKIITEPLKIHKEMTGNQRNERLAELLDLVGLNMDQHNRYPHEFSGGQRQRVGIARAIALNPKFIVLDEPVSALDVSIQAQILNLLKELQEKLDLTYLFVSHDLAVVEHMSNRIVVMYLGRIVEEGSRDDLYRNPLHPYTQSLIKSIPEIKPEKHAFSIIRGEVPSPENPPGGCHFHPRCPFAKDECREIYPETYSKNGNKVTCHLYKP
jgi:oligopeptide/dipeptide ABC transporter ATP-binding protein